MIPQISQTSPVQALYLKFLQSLEQHKFKGDISLDYANRTVLSTDNSIYQVLPQGIIYPKDMDDLTILAHLSQEKEYKKVVLSARGGGTGTNGQSLTDGLVVDVSKHMNKILEINHAEHWVRVQAGVVKDQLNNALKPFGLFFAPELSTSNRATIGGMVNTDASGQGSCLYGKTRDHVLELTTVLLDGSILHSEPLSPEALESRCEQQDRIGLVHRLLDNIAKEHHALINKTFPKLNRCLTGYDLAHIRDDKNRFNLNNILCGSEGTLGFISEIKLNVLPIPKYSALVVIRYSNFNSALRDAPRLMKASPSSIETIDSKIINLAKEDIIWQDVAKFFPGNLSCVQGVNLVEYTAHCSDELQFALDKLTTTLDDDSTNPECLGYSLAKGSTEVKNIWAMRKKAVGLLGNIQGEARPIPFIEDTAVPPEHLADYIEELRALLDSYKLDYGMFGHVDAGVLHVRPTIDMKAPDQEKLIRFLSDQVVELTQKYHGLFWGEHGKGVRSEYAPEFFGDLYPQLQRIKAAFDPHNQLNPGKIATPDKNIQLLKIDEVPTRGQEDRKIPVEIWNGYKEAVYCNGNGACHNWDPKDAMCPSWKATRDRIHTPKGRSSLIREWIKQLSELGYDPEKAFNTPFSIKQTILDWPKRIKNTLARNRGEYDFSNEVYSAMKGCLSCKSCVGQCPVKVDVPAFKGKFLSLYYTRYCRPLKDYLVGALEFMLPLASKTPKLYNAITQSSLGKGALGYLGFVDPPRLPKRSLQQFIKKYRLAIATPKRLSSIAPGDKRRSVILVQDAFTSYYESGLILDIAMLLKALGFKLLIAPYHANGKPLHVQGFLGAFTKTAVKNSIYLTELADHGIPMVGLDPAMTLTLRSEYASVLGEQVTPKVMLIQEWLGQHLKQLDAKKSLLKADGAFKLLPHCTEKTNAPESMGDWQKIFTSLGQSLEIVPVGCCGMSGTFGHEAANKEASKKLFNLSWRTQVTPVAHQGVVSATGFSCRSQAKREAIIKVPHPLQLLLKQLREQPKDKSKE